VPSSPKGKTANGGVSLGGWEGVVSGPPLGGPKTPSHNTAIPCLI